MLMRRLFGAGWAFYLALTAMPALAYDPVELRVASPPAVSDRAPAFHAFRSFDWKIAGGQTTLNFERVDGRRLAVGPVPNDLVQQALGFAADTNSSLVEVIRAEPLNDLKILLHPAVIDTPLGCELLRVSRLPAWGTDPAPKIEERLRDIERLVVIYDLAGLHAAHAINSTPWYRHIFKCDSETAKAAAEVEEKLGPWEKVHSALNDEGVTFLLDRPNNFYPPLTNAIAECSRAPSYGKFASCIGRSAVERYRAGASFVIGDIKAGEMSTVISDADYTVDDELAFARSAPAYAVSAKIALLGDPPISAMKPVRTDDFAELGELALPRDFARLGQFVQLSRLFSAILDSRIEGVRAASLTDLAKAVEGAANKRKTPRWVNMPAQLETEFLAKVEEALRSKTLADSARGPLKKCSAFLLEQHDPLRMASVPAEAWSAECSLKGTPLEREAIDLAAMREMRRSLGINDSDTEVIATGICGLPVD